MVAPINSIKHYVPRVKATVATGAISNTEIVDAVVAPANAAPKQVLEGSVVKAIYVELWIGSNEAAGSESTFILTVEKKRITETDMTNTNALNLGAYLNKKNILFTSQGIVGSLAVSGAVPVIRNWVMIPKGKQRFGLGDQFLLNVAAVGALEICGITTFKEYR